MQTQTKMVTVMSLCFWAQSSAVPHWSLTEQLARLQKVGIPLCRLKICRSWKSLLEIQVRVSFFLRQVLESEHLGHLPWVTDTHHPHHIRWIQGFFFLSVYSRPKTESFDPSLRARTKMMSCHSTACWSSPAAARSRPVCTQLPNPQTRQLRMWMRTRRRRRPQVHTQPLKPNTSF